VVWKSILMVESLMPAIGFLRKNEYQASEKTGNKRSGELDLIEKANRSLYLSSLNTYN
jgi:Holliday junction resolvase-like predicted endonuclease